jgi:cell division protein FtsL
MFKLVVLFFCILYNKAKWYGMKIDLQNIKHTLSNKFKDNDCQVTNMWNVFKETITKSAVKHIPQKRTKVSVLCWRVGSSTS